MTNTALDRALQNSALIRTGAIQGTIYFVVVYLLAKVSYFAAGHGWPIP